MTHLRPLAPGDAEILTAVDRQQEELTPFQWFGWNVGRGLETRIAEGRTLETDHGGLAVCADDGTLVGDVSWRQVQWGPPPSFCFELGIVLLSRHRGQGHGSAAQRQCADYLFEHTAIERVQASTDLENAAEQKALERAGFSREGVLRRAQWRAGGWHDLVLFSRLRGEP